MIVPLHHARPLLSQGVNFLRYEIVLDLIRQGPKWGSLEHGQVYVWLVK